MTTVLSKDGTEIAYNKQGQGHPLILVDGALCYRSFGPMPHLAELLSPHFTVYTFDRRGRGESSNSRPYAVEREVEDLDALIHAAGGEAYMYGISSGACLVLETAIRLGKKTPKIALYEPPYNPDKGSLKDGRITGTILLSCLQPAAGGMLRPCSCSSLARLQTRLPECARRPCGHCSKPSHLPWLTMLPPWAKIASRRSNGQPLSKYLRCSWMAVPILPFYPSCTQPRLPSRR
jgi:pimeloyl-ACP methyl ester carboxylesterase